jgi:hypothetical protein
MYDEHNLLYDAFAGSSIPWERKTCARRLNRETSWRE